MPKLSLSVRFPTTSRELGFTSLGPQNAPAKLRRAHARVTSTTHPLPADGCSG